MVRHGSVQSWCHVKISTDKLPTVKISTSKLSTFLIDAPKPNLNFSHTSLFSPDICGE
jgi:hypothetical protein